ncbi:MAG: hypothetical protein SFX18_17880 [Pirellulales bacterium]|nr:hypothetical protein [Pirellulales bacterium]
MMNKFFQAQTSNFVHFALPSPASLRHAALGLCLAGGVLGGGISLFAQAPKGETAKGATPATPPAATTPATGATPPAGDASPEKFSAKNLLANDVADADTPQYQKVNEAIAKFLARDLEGARKLLSEAKTAFPKLPPEEVMLARLLAAANAAPAARAELEQAVRTAPTDPEAYVLFGQIALSERRVTDADCILDRAGKLIETYSDNPIRKATLQKAYLSARALVAENRKQWGEAKQHLDAWIAMDPSSKESAPHTRLGAVLFQLGKLKESWESFNKAATLDKNAISPNLAIAMMYEQRKDPLTSQMDVKEAKKAFELALKEDPALNKERLLRSHILATQWAIAKNDLDYAKAVSSKALTIDPASQDAQLQAAILARFTRDLDRAEKLLDDLHDRYPGNFQVANQLALVLAEQNDANKRRRGAELAQLTFNANNKQGTQPQLLGEALTAVAVTQYKLGNIQEAARILQQLANNNALNSDSAYYVARILADSSKNLEALNILEKALSEPVFVNKKDAQELFESLKKKVESDGPGNAPKSDTSKASGK